MLTERTPLATPRPPRRLSRIAQATTCLAALGCVLAWEPRHLRAALAATAPAASSDIAVSAFSVECGTAEALFVCTAKISLAAGAASDADVEVAVAYSELPQSNRTRAPTAPPLWSPVKSVFLETRVATTRTVETHLFRLSPSRTYRAVVHWRVGESGARGVGAKAVEFSPQPSGVPSLDSAGGFVNVSGAPGWELLFLSTTREGWGGLVAIDGAGTVVWGLPARVVCVFAQDAQFRVGVLSAAEQYPGHSAKNPCLGSLANATNATGAEGTRSSRLSLVHATGALVATTDLACFGRSAFGYEQFTHELFFDADQRAANDTGALATIRMSAAALDADVVVDKVPTNAIYREALVRWSPSASGAVRTLVDFDAFFSPNSTRVYQSTSLPQVAARCARDGALAAVTLWMHASSAARVESTGDWLVSFVGLAAIASFSADGSTLHWIAGCSAAGLRPTPNANGARAVVLYPDDDESCFSYPHSVVPINATHVLFLDDGYMRQHSLCKHVMGGPDQTGGAFSISCYSRALVIELDFERKVFRRAWQFAATNATMRGGTTADDELPSEALWTGNGGSVAPLSSGGYLVTFGNIRQSTGDARLGVRSRSIEVDTSSGEVLSIVDIPQDSLLDNTYRVLPKHSIGGETRRSPFVE